jgi:hypothetical protein
MFTFATKTIFGPETLHLKKCTQKSKKFDNQIQQRSKKGLKNQSTKCHDVLGVSWHWVFTCQKFNFLS